jgi:hypothetical protein
VYEWDGGCLITWKLLNVATTYLLAQALSSKWKMGDYAFDAGIVTVSFESEGQGFLITD